MNHSNYAGSKVEMTNQQLKRIGIVLTFGGILVAFVGGFLAGGQPKPKWPSINNGS